MTISWLLFIDDERFPPDDGQEWKVARSYYDVGNLIYEYGMPSYISFDHDLGEKQKTGYDIAKWLVQLDMDSDELDDFGKRYPFPDDFEFYVHSQNPVGKKNIETYLLNYLDFRGKGRTCS